MRHAKRFRSRTAAFTLVELLVVIGIIGDQASRPRSRPSTLDP